MAKKQYRVLATIQGRNKKIHDFGEIVDGENFPRGNAEELVAKGFLEPYDGPEEQTDQDDQDATKILQEAQGSTDLASDIASNLNGSQQETAEEQSEGTKPRAYDDITVKELKEILGDNAPSDARKKELYNLYVQSLS